MPAPRALAWLAPHRLTGLSVPMALWALHFVVVYGLQGVACARGAMRVGMAGVEAVTWAFALATAVALALIAWQGVRGWRGWRRAAAARPGDDGAGRRRFLCAVTAITAALAAIATCFTAIPILLLPTCG